MTKRVKDLETAGPKMDERPIGEEEEEERIRETSIPPLDTGTPDILITEVAEDVERLMDAVEKLELQVQDVDKRLDHTTETIDEQIRELQDLVADIPSQFGINPIIPEESPSRLSAAERFGNDTYPRSNVIQVGSHQGGSKTLVYNRSGILTVARESSGVIRDSPSGEGFTSASHHARLHGTHSTTHSSTRPRLLTDFSEDASPDFSALDQVIADGLEEEGDGVEQEQTGSTAGTEETIAEVEDDQQEGTEKPSSPTGVTPQDLANVRIPSAKTPGGAIAGYKAGAAPPYRSGDESGFIDEATTSAEEGGALRDRRTRRGYKTRGKLSKLNVKKSTSSKVEDGQGVGGGSQHDMGGGSQHGMGGGSQHGTVGDNDGEMVDRETFDAFVQQNDEQIMGLQKKIETLRLGMGLIESQGKLKALDNRISNTMDLLKNCNIPTGSQARSCYFITLMVTS